MSTILRETSGYIVHKSPRGYRITSKEKNVECPSRVVSEGVWNQLRGMSDSSFNGSCCLELGIGAWKRTKPNYLRMG